MGGVGGGVGDVDEDVDEDVDVGGGQQVLNL